MLKSLHIRWIKVNEVGNRYFSSKVYTEISFVREALEKDDVEWDQCIASTCRLSQCKYWNRLLFFPVSFYNEKLLQLSKVGASQLGREWRVTVWYEMDRVWERVTYHRTYCLFIFRSIFASFFFCFFSSTSGASANIHGDKMFTQSI